MLTFDGFVKYKMYNVSSDDIDNTLLCVHYYVQAMNDLNNYLNNYSENMRTEGLNKFGNKYTVSRRILSF